MICKNIKYYPEFNENDIMSPTFELRMTYVNATEVKMQ